MDTSTQLSELRALIKALADRVAALEAAAQKPAEVQTEHAP